MKKLILLKLGGSLITDKTRPFMMQRDRIKNITREIGEALSKNRELQLIIGTGAGSFGHYPVTEYGIEHGSKTDNELYGFCKVHSSVEKLNAAVVEELLALRIKAFSIHPSSMMLASRGIISQFFFEPIISMVKKKIIPTVHGDIIYDTSYGSTICSVETFFHQLVMKLNGSKNFTYKVIYAGLTDGVLDSKQNTIQVITKKNLRSLEPLFFKVRGYDVTGGMKSKVLSCLQLTDYGAESCIVNGSVKGNIKNALLGKKVRGTTITGVES